MRSKLCRSINRLKVDTTTCELEGVLGCIRGGVRVY